MTKEEAIKILSDVDHAWRNFSQEEYVALEMAIKALKQEPCGDCISRKAVLEGKVIHQSCDGVEIINSYAVPVEYIEQLPSVTPKQNDVLDKIRAEIEQEYNRLSATRADETLEVGECLGLKMALKIVGKYKAESEE